MIQMMGLLAACTGSVPEDAGLGTVDPPVEVRVLLQGAPRPGGGKLVVQTEYDTQGQVEVPTPTAEGLTFEPDGPPTMEALGPRDVVTQSYVFKGRPGHYEVPPLVATWSSHNGSDEVTAESLSLFFDIEVDPLSVGPLADIEEPAALRSFPWVPVVSIGAVFAVGLLVAFWPRGRREEEEAAPLPPHAVALAAWEAVRANPDLSDEDRARELSVIFRTYAEDALHFEASAWTTSEILVHLRGLEQLPDGNVPRAKRMLRATDKIKYAEERPTGELIEELDADLRAFIDATRPRVWSEG